MGRRRRKREDPGQNVVAGPWLIDRREGFVETDYRQFYVQTRDAEYASDKVRAASADEIRALVPLGQRTKYSVEHPRWREPRWQEMLRGVGYR